MASILDYFIGTTQSKYASIAIFSAITVICIAILFTNTDITMGNRIAVVFFIFAMCVFPISISLFELTCIVTGGKQNGKYNLCHIYAWVITAMIILYCTVLIIVTIASMFTYKKALDKINASDNSNTISHVDANTIAKNMIDNNDTSNGSYEAKQLHPVSNSQEYKEHVVASPEQFVSAPEPVMVASKPVKQVKQIQEESPSNIVGFDSDDKPYMEYDIETFVQQPVKKMEQKNNSDFNPEPFSEDSYATL